MSTQTDRAGKRFHFDIWLNKHQQGRSVLQQGKYEGYLAALSELEAQPSQTEDLEARAREWLLGEHGGLWKEQVDGVVRTTNGQSSILKLCAAFARSLAQPSAPTVDQIMDVVRKESGITDDRLEDGEDHGAALVKMECAIEAQLTKLLNP